LMSRSLSYLVLITTSAIIFSESALKFSGVNMISVDFHVKGMQELEDRFDRMEHASKKKIIRRILQFSFVPFIRPV
jgi:hypothetical protein